MGMSKRDTNGGGGCFFRGLFGLILLAGIGYNTYETALLRAEVEALKGHRNPAVAGGNAIPLVDEARRRIAEAEGFLRKKDYGAALRELNQAAEAARSASVGAQAKSQAAVAQLSARVTALRAQVEALSPSKPTTEATPLPPQDQEGKKKK